MLLTDRQQTDRHTWKHNLLAELSSFTVQQNSTLTI